MASYKLSSVTKFTQTAETLTWYVLSSRIFTRGLLCGQECCENFSQPVDIDSQPDRLIEIPKAPDDPYIIHPRDDDNWGSQSASNGKRAASVGPTWCIDLSCARRHLRAGRPGTERSRKAEVVLCDLVRTIWISLMNDRAEVETFSR